MVSGSPAPAMSLEPVQIGSASRTAPAAALRGQLMAGAAAQTPASYASASPDPGEASPALSSPRHPVSPRVLNRSSSPVPLAAQDEDSSDDFGEELMIVTDGADCEFYDPNDPNAFALAEAMGRAGDDEGNVDWATDDIAGAATLAPRAPEGEEGISMSSPPAQRFVSAGLGRSPADLGHGRPGPDAQSDPSSTPAVCQQPEQGNRTESESPERVRVQSPPPEPGSESLSPQGLGQPRHRSTSAPLEDGSKTIADGDDSERGPGASETSEDAEDDSDHTAYRLYEQERMGLTADKIKGLLALLFMIIFCAFMYFGLNIKLDKAQQ